LQTKTIATKLLSVSETNQCRDNIEVLISLGVVVAVMAIALIIMAIAIYRLRRDRRQQAPAVSGGPLFFMCELQQCDICPQTETLCFWLQLLFIYDYNRVVPLRMHSACFFLLFTSCVLNTACCQLIRLISVPRTVKTSAVLSYFGISLKYLV